MTYPTRHFTSLGIFAGACLASSWLMPVPAAQAASYTDPSTTQTFWQAVASLPLMQYYDFGTGAGKRIQNLTDLAGSFNPYGIAGSTTINEEWEVYQPFNTSNFVFTADKLNLTATIPSKGGLFPGGIDSGQFWTQAAYAPGKTGAAVYAMLVHMKIPTGQGMWPAAWLYSAAGAGIDTSEVDLVEFMDMKNQNTYDWTGFDHGPGNGATIFSRKTNPWVWHPGIDFSAGFHDYQLIWTPDATFRYVDGTLIFAQYFTWTSKMPAQFGVNLAVGSNEPGATGLFPVSLSQFPSFLSIDHIAIWGQ